MPFQLHLRKRFAARFIGGRNDGYESVVASYKRRLFSDLHGDVLEIGPGGGANLAYYPRHIRWVGVEPNPFMHKYLRAEAGKLGLQPELRSGVAERLDVPDDSIDAVVGTLVLCSVSDQQAALREMLRVLKPGGRYLFVEHVAAARGTRLRRLQNWIRPVWQFVGDGCQPNRDTGAVIERAGFSSVRYESFSVAIAIAGPHIAGLAVK